MNHKPISCIVSTFMTLGFSGPASRFYISMNVQSMIFISYMYQIFTHTTTTTTTTTTTIVFAFTMQNTGNVTCDFMFTK